MMKVFLAEALNLKRDPQGLQTYSTLVFQIEKFSDRGPFIAQFLLFRVSFCSLR